MTEQCQEWIQFCVSKYPCKGSVLEVGSFDVNGNPRHHFKDKTRFPEYVGIDMREGPCVDRVMNTQQMDFADASFDVIVDAERLEHDNRFWVTVKELYRVMKPGGYIIVTTRSWGGMHPHAYPYDYWRFMDSGLKDLLEFGGFEVLATAYGERWAGGDKAVFAVARKPVELPKEEEKRPWHVVILSKNPENVTNCIQAIFANEPGLDPKRIIVVDDGLPDNLNLRNVRVVKGVKPFIFSRNANLGIRLANSDVILLNDDAILETPGGFSLLAQRTGLASAAIRGFVGNEEQKPQDDPTSVRQATKTLCFVAIFIPKDVQKRIGLLDERFTEYGFEDNDYCYRASQAGIPLQIVDGCVVEHESSPSTYRSNPAWMDKMAKAQRIYLQKYA